MFEVKTQSLSSLSSSSLIFSIGTSINESPPEMQQNQHQELKNINLNVI